MASVAHTVSEELGNDDEVSGGNVPTIQSAEGTQQRVAYLLLLSLQAPREESP